MGTSIREDLKDGIIPIDEPSSSKDVLPPSAQPTLKSKSESIEFDMKVISSPVFSDGILKERMTRKRGIS
ncbi:hypothetical protein E5676_scaffold692G00840 [Cucumis melo var. makuwa]|uniref:Uncharacterized protein n=1 Tax=Cucumis melo var. makuwa TaxID=1194695 RepID=A0A5A7UZL5_CUCMM|nr:hypothetical protein E6C27_scaffold749G00820 [Cucumis melo var. makuwa]TYK14747.1 hypothetical protein E5676_scaffold692G00840 [Cucumis melo var. makuwa]